MVEKEKVEVRVSHAREREKLEYFNDIGLINLTGSWKFIHVTRIQRRLCN